MVLGEQVGRWRRGAGVRHVATPHLIQAASAKARAGAQSMLQAMPARRKMRRVPTFVKPACTALAPTCRRFAA